MSERPCLVAFGAHAADVEFSAGATILKHARAGWDCHIVHLTLGEKGSVRLSAVEYGEQKRQEALEAAAVLQATVHFLPFCDGELVVEDEVATHLAQLLRRQQPKVILTHWCHSIHADHEATYALTQRAVFMACNRHFELNGLPPMRWARQYFPENWEDPGEFRPFVYTDISEEMADWERACKCYAIGRGEGGYPYWDRYEAQTRIRGIEIGVGHAQAFAVDESAWRQTRELL